MTVSESHILYERVIILTCAIYSWPDLVPRYYGQPDWSRTCPILGFWTRVDPSDYLRELDAYK